MSQMLVLYMGSLFLRSIGIAVIAGVCTWRMRNVAMRHAVWTAVLGVMLLIPIADSVLPAEWVPLPVQGIAAQRAIVFRETSTESPVTSAIPPIPTSVAVAPNSDSRTEVWWTVAAASYGMVAFFMLARLGLAYRRILKLERTATQIPRARWERVVPVPEARRSRVLKSGAVRVPLTVGFLKPVVLLPSEWEAWDDGKLRAVLLHEFAHVRRNDWAIAAVAALAKSVYWMNPLSWFLERELAELAEKASDDVAIGSTDSIRYAEILLEFAAVAGSERRYLRGGIPMAQTKTQARIERVLSGKRIGTGTLRVVGWMLVLILAVPVLYSASALHVSPQTSATPAKPVVVVQQAQQARTLPVEVQRGRGAAPVEIVVPQTRPQTPVTPPATSPTTPRESIGEGPYLIRPNDVLEIYVWKNSDLGGPVKVQPDGNLSIPLVQDIQAAGLTPGQLKLAIERRLRDRLETPDVTVILREAASYRVSVAGRVKKPGPVASETALTVLDALALAGGFENYAKSDQIRIIRTVTDADGQRQTTNYSFSYPAVIAGDSKQNLLLKAGDIVVVP